MRRVLLSFVVLVFASALIASVGMATAQDTTPEPSQSELLAPLVEVLEDDAARQKFVEALRETVPDGGVSPAGEEPVLAAQLAQRAVAFATDIRGQIGQSLRDIGRLSLLPELLTEERMARIRSEAPALLLTILVTALLYRVIRFASRRIVRRDAAARQPKPWSFFAQFLMRILAVVVATFVGFAVSPVFYGEAGLAPAQSVYLVAFLAFGLLSVLLSIFVTKYTEDVTFSGLDQKANTVIYNKTRLTFGVLVYGLGAAVPIVQDWVNFVAARSVRTTIVLVGALLAVWTIWRISAVIETQKVQKLMRSAKGDGQKDGFPTALAQRSLSLWDRFWPVLGYLYVAIATLVALARPNVMVEFLGRATLLSALALVAVLGGLRLFSIATRGVGVRLPDALRRALPTLQTRLSTFATPVLVLGGVALLLTAVLLMLDGWQIVDVRSWLSGQGADFLWRIASVLLILTALILTWVILASWIDRKLMAEGDGPQVSARSRTLLALFRNALSIALVIFGGMTALSELGLDIAPLLAGAGVIGLAIGFGAQKLVQDIITGIFIQLENAINEDDVITVAGITGTVEKLSIRSVGIRDLSGVFHLIPFSAVDTVSNASRVFSYHVEIVGVAYETDLELAERALVTAFEQLKETEHGRAIIAPMEFHGVVGLADSAVNLRVRIKTRPGEQWALGRAYTALVKRALDEAGIEIPFPHRELRLPKEMLAGLLPQPKPED